MTSPSAVSRGEFSGRVAVPRVLDVLKRESVTASFFVPGITIEAWPDLCHRILDEGHEIGHHGYHHITPVTMEEAAERERLERGLDAMDRVLNGHRALGYRSPGAELSPNSARLLAENGFIYESSMSAQDFEPYWCRTGDVIEPNGVATFGPEIELLEIPFSWTLADFPQTEFVPTPNGVFIEGLSDPLPPRDHRSRGACPGAGADDRQSQGAPSSVHGGPGRRRGLDQPPPVRPRRGGKPMTSDPMTEPMTSGERAHDAAGAAHRWCSPEVGR